VYESNDYIHLVLEYIKNRQIFSTIKKKVNYSEATAARVMNSLLQVIAYIHSKQIIYRDINPENIMLLYYLFILIEEMAINLNSNL